MDCEVLLCPQTANRGGAILKAMLSASSFAGVKCFVGDQYRASSKWLMTYGLGHPQRRAWYDAHLAAGGRLIGWDLGYWDRDTAMRLTIDQDHPQHLLRDLDGSRFNNDGIELRDDWNPYGPIILAALGRKTRASLNDSSLNWERETLNAIKDIYPKRIVQYRSKRPETFANLPIAKGTIEQAMKGAALIVCRHSNVAVDACFAGIPVVCSDGIGAALYGNDLRNVEKPDAAARLRFLQNVAWWQWRPTEALEAWKHIISILT